MSAPPRLHEEYPAVADPLELGALQKALRRSRRGIYLVVINTPILRQAVRAWLEKMLGRPIHRYEATADRPLLEQIRHADALTPPQGILWIEGLEALPVSAIQTLNRQRAGLRSLTHPLVFCLPEFLLERFQQNAPDVFDWHRGLYELYAPHDPQALRQILALLPWFSLSAEERKRQIPVLEEMRNEYQARGEDAALPGVLRVLARRYTEEGLLDHALSLYQQALEIFERLGDLRGKSATLHAMAYIYAVRGDLDGAMQLYQQALEIFERLGDRRGQAITMGMMAQVLWAKGERKQALALLLGGLRQLSELGIEPQTQREMAAVLARWRQELGAEAFDALWREVTGGQPLPAWLSPPAREEDIASE